MSRCEAWGDASHMSDGLSPLCMPRRGKHKHPQSLLPRQRQTRVPPLRSPSHYPPPQVFLNRVASHPVLKASRELQRFLESNEDEFALEVARASAVR